MVLKVLLERLYRAQHIASGICMRLQCEENLHVGDKWV